MVAMRGLERDLNKTILRVEAFHCCVPTAWSHAKQASFTECRLGCEKCELAALLRLTSSGAEASRIRSSAWRVRNSVQSSCNLVHAGKGFSEPRDGKH